MYDNYKEAVVIDHLFHEQDYFHNDEPDAGDLPLERINEILDAFDKVISEKKFKRYQKTMINKYGFI